MLRDIILCDEELNITREKVGNKSVVFLTCKNIVFRFLTIYLRPIKILLSVLHTIQLNFTLEKNSLVGSKDYHTHTHKHTYTPNIRSPFAYPGGGACSRSVCVPLRGAVKNAKGTFFRYPFRDTKYVLHQTHLPHHIIL